MFDQKFEPQFTVEVTNPKTKKVVDQRNFLNLEEAEQYFYSEQRMGSICHLYRKEFLTEGEQ